MKLIVFSLIFFASVFAQAELDLSLKRPPAPSGESVQMLGGVEIFTKESVVEYQGRKYRKIEYRNEIFYLSALSDETSGSQLELLCKEQGAPIFNLQSPPLVLASVKVTKRTAAFIEGLKVACVSGGADNGKLALDPSLRIGLRIEDSPNSAIKNKKVYINPGSLGLGFSGDW